MSRKVEGCAEKFAKKQTYQFCEIRNAMVQLEVIQSTATMPDLVHAEARLVPVGVQSRPSSARAMESAALSSTQTALIPCPGIWNGMMSVTVRDCQLAALLVCM